MSRHLPSPGLLAFVAAVGLGAGAAVSQDGKLPPPRVVGEAPKSKAEAPPKPKDVPAAAKDEPKKGLTFDPVPDKAADKKKEEPKAEAREPEAPKAEPKKDEPKVDPLAEVKAAAEKAGKDATDGIRHGDNAWVLAASALVLLMTPGLALFYGGMVRKKNVLATMMQSYAAMAVVGLYWIAVGYGLAFGPSQIKVERPRRGGRRHHRLGLEAVLPPGHQPGGRAARATTSPSSPTSCSRACSRSSPRP